MAVTGSGLAIEFGSDRALVLAAAAGDHGAWDQLVERYAQLVWAVACDHGLDPERAGDVSVLTWMRCADHLGDAAVIDGVRDWLVRAAERECAIETARQRSHHPSWHHRAAWPAPLDSY